MTMETGTDKLSSHIFRAILIVVLLTVVLYSAVSVWALYDTIGLKEQRDLRNSLLLVEQNLPQTENRSAYVNSLGTDETRVTWIDSDGTVLYDSLSPNPSTLDSHDDRPEVIEALDKGEGQSSRYSNTFSEVTYYHALRLDDGTILRFSSSHNTALSVLNRLVVPGILIVIAIVIVAMIVAQWIARRTMAPLSDLNLDEPFQAGAYSELQPLFNRISQQREQIEQRTREAEENRRAFVANVSHELKTPLTVISGYAELLKGGLVKPEDNEQVLTLIHEEAGYMQALVDDILTLSKLDEYTATGNTSDHAVLVDLARVSTEVLARLAPFAEQNEVNTKLTCKGDVILFGMEKILTSVIYNLSENAIRYNRPGGSMSIDIFGTDDEVCLTVSDTGIGIAPQDQPRVFERFYRVDQTHSRETGGTGLGLAIVKRGAFYHKGTITLDSIPDEGTIITIAFPRTPK